MRKFIPLFLLSLVLGLALYTFQKDISLPESDGNAPEETESMSAAKSKIQYITNNAELFPQVLLESVKRNPEIVDFAYDYPEKKGRYSKNIDLAHRYRQGEIPLFLQWDSDWGYAPYGQSVIGIEGCGPTSLSMVYVGLTGDLLYNPQAMATFSEENGYFDSKNKTTLWTLMSEGAVKLGLKVKELPLDENIMVSELSKGHPIISSMRPGDFTTTGHFIVIYDYEDGSFRVHDSNSRSRSEKTWSYSTIESQIKNLWSFSK